jgi:hypothetical protein
MNVGERYVTWANYRAHKLSDAEKAEAYEQFAKDFDEMPRDREPFPGWADEMAYCCRRLAMWSRGETPEVWVPAYERKRQ